MKKYVIVIFCLITFILGSVFAVKWYERHQTNKIVMNYLQEKKYDKNIKTKEIKYDWKQGGFYIEVIYKDEPEYRYEYYPRRSEKHGVFIMGFDEQNVSLRINNKGKYMDYDDS
ncbi:uncharacterized protein YxeA [Bacillus thermophilus]|uniref:Uncharacterized protein YxeA n=1 Tax=Siminovitchia thermophila TaxID=1245522 RepID=A0ABS2R4U6_9BACI|nr:DUF3139 domain-containing protein [Siminovitchia thermophila]MBM7713938.1 uncharacterized protein YxeA [Siminovitchia thermophila]ONK23824.1 hypothetical protein BLX87_08175 [Bacillus sp. VT-16-64]